MSTPRDRLAQTEAHIRTLRVGLAAAFALVLVTSGGWFQATRPIPPITIPPDLSAGAQVVPGQFTKPYVYDFARSLWQLLHRWQTNGQREYRHNIGQYSAYLTPECRRHLTEDMQTLARNGDLVGRTRALLLQPGMIFDPANVRVESRDRWTVALQFELLETLNGYPVKEGEVYQWLLPVARYAVSPMNAYALALDCNRHTVPTRVQQED